MAFDQGSSSIGREMVGFTIYSLKATLNYFDFGLDMMCQRKKGVKNKSKILGLIKGKDRVDT